VSQPTPDELAAIVAAVEMTWPRPVIVEPADEPANPWRFSGRWWSRPAAARRDRPWLR
jgi:hypothetical protein